MHTDIYLFIFLCIQTPVNTLLLSRLKRIVRPRAASLATKKIKIEEYEHKQFFQWLGRGGKESRGSARVLYYFFFV